MTDQKGIDPPQSLDTTHWYDYWLPWLKRFQDAFPKQEVYSVAVTPASVGANTTSEQTFTVTGLTTNDHITVNKPTHQTGLGIVGARVSAANTAAITYMNTTGGAIVPTSETYTFHSIRK